MKNQTTRFILRISAMVTFTAAISACAQRPFALSPLTRDTPNGALTNHVIVVSVDGLRTDAIARFNAAAISRLMRLGSYTLDARTVLPSLTLPSHTSMLTGELPGKHGIVWNDDETDSLGTIRIPTVFGLARAKGFHTAAFFSKAKFNHLESDGTLDYSQAPDGKYPWTGRRTVGDVERYLASRRPNLLFVHIGDPDYAGHTAGWMSWLYARAVRSADAAVNRLVVAADRSLGPGKYTLILTADHGGNGRTHGTAALTDVTIPWIAFGRGVRAGSKLGAGIRTVDTAATVLWLLGLEPTTPWSGVPVKQAFIAETQVPDGTK